MLIRDLYPEQNFVIKRQIHEKMLTIIRETQIKTTMRYHLTLSRKAIIFLKKESASIGKDV